MTASSRHGKDSMSSHSPNANSSSTEYNNNGSSSAGGANEHSNRRGGPSSNKSLNKGKGSSRNTKANKKKQSKAEKEEAAISNKDLIQKVEHLAKFDACIEAADCVAAAAGHRVAPVSRIDEATGLHDCSVLVSADGDLLLVPQGEHQTLYLHHNHNPNPNPNPKQRSESTTDSDDYSEKTNEVASSLGELNLNQNTDTHDDAYDESESEMQQNQPQLQQYSSAGSVSELMVTNKTDYESAVFLGNDLQPTGDRALNGFSAKGWSVPATSMALQQSERCLQDLSQFCEEMVLGHKEAAARATQACDNLRMAHPAMGGGNFAVSATTTARQREQREQQEQYSSWEMIDPASTDFEITQNRVGPLLASGGTNSGALLALEHYYSIMAEKEADRWRSASLQRHTGLLPALQQASSDLNERISKRSLALQESSRRARIMEDRLHGLKDDAVASWQAVYQAEDMVTMRVEEIMQNRSREREMRRLDQLREEEVKQQQDNANGVLGATSEEIWDIVSAVAESMDNGSFEPLDMPQAPLSTPRDKSRDDDSLSVSAANSTDTRDTNTPSVEGMNNIPLASRENIELEVGLPELRAAAMAADDAVEDAAGSLLNIISNLDTTRRAARVAAETCLVSASHAQAECIRSMIRLERDGLEDRLRHLKELELMADGIDVRADLDAYITMDKQERGGSSHLGDDDDGGVASALAVLSSHVDGNMGQAPVPKIKTEADEEKDKEDTTTPEMIEKAIEALFDDIKLLYQSTPESPVSTKARLEFDTSMDSVCKIASENSPSARAKRSSICYFLNSKRSSNAEIKTHTQFDALCRVFGAILTGCSSEDGGVSNAKMCMMLAQTFYIVNQGSSSGSDEDEDDGQAEGRSQRVYAKIRLSDHVLWSKDDFW